MKLTAFAVGLITVGGALLGIVQVSTSIQRHYSVPLNLFDWLAIGGVALCLAGVVLLLIVQIGVMLDLRKLVRRVERLLERFEKGGIYLPREVESGELEALRTFVAEALETDEITPLETMRQLCEKNPEIIQVVVRQPPATSGNGASAPATICGYFCIFPLTRAAAKLVAMEALTGNNVGPDHIVRARSRPAAIYIGGVAAKGRSKPSGYILAHLQAHLWGAARRGIPVYARPVTKDGLRLMRQYKFKPLKPSTSAGDELGRIHVWSPWK